MREGEERRGEELQEERNGEKVKEMSKKGQWWEKEMELEKREFEEGGESSEGIAGVKGKT